MNTGEITSVNDETPTEPSSTTLNLRLLTTQLNSATDTELSETEASLLKHIENSLVELSKANKDEAKRILWNLLFAHRIHGKPSDMFVNNKESSIAYIRLESLNTLSLYKLYVAIGEWTRLKALYDKDKFMKSYIIIIESLPTEIDEDVLKFLQVIRMIFPFSKEGIKIFLKVFVNESETIKSDNTLTLKGETLLKLFERSRLDKISFIAVDSNSDTLVLIDSILKDIFPETEVTT